MNASIPATARREATTARRAAGAEPAPRALETRVMTAVPTAVGICCQGIEGSKQARGELEKARKSEDVQASKKQDE
jgi:hypothetical protein